MCYPLIERMGDEICKNQMKSEFISSNTKVGYHLTCNFGCYVIFHDQNETTMQGLWTVQNQLRDWMGQLPSPVKLPRPN